MYRILLVEDDHALAEEMKKTIESQGNEVRTVTDFNNVIGEFRAYMPQLVLMDIMLPYKDGYYRTGEIRQISKVPVIFISSASDSMNIVMAINMGGDDFIAKPVSPPVLNAKISAVLRRTYELNDTGAVIAFGGGTLNLNDGSVTFADKRVELTKNEFRILQALLENRGRIVSREALMLRLWNDDCFVEENTLTVNVARLRKKLEEAGMTNPILTRPGSGYILS